MTHALAQSYLLELDAEQAEPLVLRAWISPRRVEQHRRPLARGPVGRTLASIRGDAEAAIASYEEARRSTTEIGATALEATLGSISPASHLEQGELDTAEQLLRDSVRVLPGVGDRAHLCEAQRILAQLLVRRAGSRRRSGSRSSRARASGPKTALHLDDEAALGVVRAAQGRDEEGEELMRAALEE